jgi:beta-glucosidase
MDIRLQGATAALVAAACVTFAGALPGTASAATRATAPAATTTTGSTATAGPSCPWLNQDLPISTRVSKLLASMSLTQEVSLLEGHGSSNPYVFFEPAIPSLCIPQLGEEDGPNGAGDGLAGVTQLPAGVNLAATFSDSLARRYGTVVGSEEFGKGAAVNLGPTINIDRDPRWGRSFESFTEDPYLDGRLGSAEVDGVQSTGELSQVKHYAVYNQETNRNTPADNSIVAERTLQEIYLKAFHTVIDTAAPASVMCSYATINGADACDDAALENGVLKTDWGFPGWIGSDYGALHSDMGISDGTDVEQPENTYFAPLVSEVTSGMIPQAVVNTALARVFTQMFRFNLFNAPPTGNVNDVVTTPAHVRIATKVAESSATLLKNSDHTLPLSANHAGTVAVIGPSADASPTYGGGGSARVVPTDPVSPLTGLEAAAHGGTHLTYTPGLPTDSSVTAPQTGTYVFAVTNPCGCYTPAYLSINGTQELDNPGTPPQDAYSVAVPLTAGETYTIGLSGPTYSAPGLTWATPSALAPGIAQAVTAAKAASTAVVVVSDDTETEAADRLGLSLPSAQDELIEAVAAANPRTVVVVEAGAPVTMPWLSNVSAVLDTWYPGEVEGTALASTLFGSSDPGGHLPVTFPQSLSQVPAFATAQFPGMNDTVQYSEGLNVGYRFYDAENLTPLFPFGYGLSYTSFQYSHLRISKSPDGATGDVTVSATVTNTGSRAGADVAQLYLGDPAAATEAPRQLAGYERVSLRPGQSRVVSFQVTPQSESWWDTTANGWTSSPGAYGVYVGDSSALAGLPLQGSFTLPSTPGARQVNVTAPSTMTPGRPSTVTVTLSASGTQTLDHVRLALQLPQGWAAEALGGASFADVAPGRALAARFQVVPVADSPNVTATIHATATLGPDLTRESGVMVTVR